MIHASASSIVSAESTWNGSRTASVGNTGTPAATKRNVESTLSDACAMTAGDKAERAPRMSHASSNARLHDCNVAPIRGITTSGTACSTPSSKMVGGAPRSPAARSTTRTGSTRAIT
jgi:hypothetical protein